MEGMLDHEDPVVILILLTETNYDRVLPPHDLASEAVSQPSPSSGTPTTTVDLASEEKQFHSTTTRTVASDVEIGQATIHRPKTFWQKLGVVDKKRPNRMVDIFKGPFKGFTYPVIVYAGLLYGANALVWSGVQNATTGTVYTKYYGFSTTGVAAAYSGGLIGAFIG